MVTSKEDLIELNVGGVTQGFTFRRSLLCSVPGTPLELMFSGRHELKLIDGKVFIDRDPKLFIHVINFLRNNNYIPQSFDRTDHQMIM